MMATAAKPWTALALSRDSGSSCHSRRLDRLLPRKRTSARTMRITYVGMLIEVKNLKNVGALEGTDSS